MAVLPGGVECTDQRLSSSVGLYGGACHHKSASGQEAHSIGAKVDDLQRAIEAARGDISQVLAGRLARVEDATLEILRMLQSAGPFQQQAAASSPSAARPAEPAPVPTRPEICDHSWSPSPGLPPGLSQQQAAASAPGTARPAERAPVPMQSEICDHSLSPRLGPPQFHPAGFAIGSLVRIGGIQAEEHSRFAKLNG